MELIKTIQQQYIAGFFISVSNQQTKKKLFSSLFPNERWFAWRLDGEKVDISFWKKEENIKEAIEWFKHEFVQVDANWYNITKEGLFLVFKRKENEIKLQNSQNEVFLVNQLRNFHNL